MNKRNILEEIRLTKNKGPYLIQMKTYAGMEGQTVGVCRHPSEYISPYHTHDFFEINYVYSGRCNNLVEEQSIIMSQGDMILIHPGAFHSPYAGKNCKVLNFLIDKEWLLNEVKGIIPCENPVYDFFERAGHKDFYKFAVFYKGNTAKQKKRIAKRLIDAKFDTSPVKHLLMETIIIELLALLMSEPEYCQLSDRQGRNTNKMVPLLTFVAENFATVTLEMISEKYFYSKTHICRMFLKHTGKTFNQTVIDIRIANAIALLKTTDLTVEKIAMQVGYDSVEYFQRLFKKKTGISPGEYKRETARQLEQANKK